MKLRLLLVFIVLTAFLAAVACSGSDGSNGRDGGDGVTRVSNPNWVKTNRSAEANRDCIGCHTQFATAQVDNSTIIRKIIGTGAADNTMRNNYQGGVHFQSQYSSVVSTTDISAGCYTCHFGKDYGTGEFGKGMGREDNRILRLLFPQAMNVADNRIGVASCITCHGMEGGHYGTVEVSKQMGGREAKHKGMSATWGSCDFCHEANPYFGTTEENPNPNVNPAANRHNPPHGETYFSRNAGLNYKDGKHFNGAAHNSTGTYPNLVDQMEIIPTVWNAEGVKTSGSNCVYCHSHNYAVRYNPMKGSLANVDDAIDEVMYEKAVKLNNGTRTTLRGLAAVDSIGCSVCHNPHTGGLNGEAFLTRGGQLDSFGNSIWYSSTDSITLPSGAGALNVDLTDVNGDDIPSSISAAVSAFVRDNNTDLTVLSQEFVLCTSCHFVQIKYKWMMDEANNRPAYKVLHNGSGTGGRVFTVNKFEYYWDNATGEPEDANSNHAHGGGDFGNFVKSHFKDSNTGKGGLNINAASPTACTACHDPHSTTRFGPIINGETAAISDTEITKDQIDGILKTYSESGHANYAGLGFNRNSYGGSKGCAPCHNGRQATKHMEKGTATAFGSNPYYGMQMQLVNGKGGTTAGCGTCHDLDKSVGYAAADRPNGIYLSGSQIIRGALRSNGNVDNGDNFTLAAGGGGAGTPLVTRADKMPQLMFAKQKADGALACITCHGGRTSVYWKARYNNTAQVTYHDNGTGANDEYAHYAPGGGVVAGVLLPKVKGAAIATSATAIVPRMDFTTTKTNWAKLSNTSGHPTSVDSYPKCALCHDVNSESHTFAVFKDSAGKPITAAVNKYHYGNTTKIDDITGLYLNNDKHAGCTCHGAASDSGVSRLKNDAYMFAEVMEFFEEAIQQAGDDGYAIQYYGSGGTTFNVWDKDATPAAWRGNNSSGTSASAEWRGLDGYRRYLVAMVFEILHYDYGAYAHADGQIKDILGEALVVLHRLNSSVATTDGTTFNTWLNATANATVEGRNFGALSAAAKTWLCGSGTTACEDKYDEWE